jgi:hypothetical protein
MPRGVSSIIPAHLVNKYPYKIKISGYDPQKADFAYKKVKIGKSPKKVYPKNP